MADKKEARPIPISAAEGVARQFGYDQVVIYARKVDENGVHGKEHMTTYGKNPDHCSVAARMGKVLQKFMGWDV